MLTGNIDDDILINGILLMTKLKHYQYVILHRIFHHLFIILY